ncbi:unnamed protein product [Lactuca virosa]|uniref:Uncharacterized protein n=1 Tax=Lactuca virosa TaxID=75947 RepID=A0AAU9LC16_9ASTR|nr:unnamed protein product [Lactuca virosa]
MILWSFNKIGKLRDTVWLLSVFEMKKDLILQARLPLLIRILVKITQRTTQIMNMVNQVKVNGICTSVSSRNLTTFYNQTTDTAMLLVYTFRRQDIQVSNCTSISADVLN